MKLLFIGNSATYVHKIPQTLAALAAPLGYEFEVAEVTRGGYTLSQHADASTEHGQRLLKELQNGYDVVFLQDNGNCITTPARRADCEKATYVLTKAVRESGAIPCFYVRPPYGKYLEQWTPLEQCYQFDALFSKLAKELKMPCVFVNRAFARAIGQGVIELWGPDHAHTSPEGAYLAVCTFFGALTGKSARELGSNGLESASLLQAIADRVLEENHPLLRDFQS